MSTVLITGCSGRVGKAALAFLGKSGRGLNLRACTRSMEKADYLKSIGATEVVRYDLADKETWAPALEGVSMVFSSSMDSLLNEHMEFAKFLGTRKEQIKHVVRVSCFGADTNTNSYDKEVHASIDGARIPLMLQHYWWSEECLIKEGLPVTSIRGNFYMNHLLKNERENIKNEGFFSSPLGNCKNSFVCTNDMGEAAAKIFCEGPERHANKFYDITGPESHSMHEIAAILGSVMGKKIEYRPLDIDQFQKDFGPARREFFEYLRNGFYTRCSPDFYNLLGKRPTTYQEYLTNKGPFGETGAEELFSEAGAIFKKGEDAFKNLDNIKKD